MGANDFKNREVTIVDLGSHVQFVSNPPTDSGVEETIITYEKIDPDGIPLDIIVEGNNFQLIRGSNGIGTTLETFDFADVVSPSTDSAEELALELFIIVQNIVALGSPASQTETNAEVLGTKFVSPQTLGGWLTDVLTRALTWAGQLTFTLSPIFSSLTASRIVETDGSKKLLSVDKETAYNKSFGTGAGTVTEGNDSRLSDSRAPNGPAGGDLEGNYPNPTVTNLRSDVVVVEVLADFPAPAASVITLAADTIYSIVGSIALAGNRIVYSVGSVLISPERGKGILIYTGTGIMLTSVDVDLVLTNIEIHCPNGDVFDSRDTVGNEKTNFTLIRGCAFIDIDTYGQIENRLLVAFRECIFQDSSSDGIIFVGSQNGDLFIFNNIVRSFTGTMFDLGASVWDLIHFNACELHTTAGQTMLSGTVANANLSANGRARVSNCNFLEAGTFLNNITTDDLKWRFFLNSGVDDSDIIGEYIVTAPASTTILNGTYSLIAGTTTLQKGRRFSQSANMTLRYDGLEDISNVVTVALNGIKDSGADREYDIAIFKNGSIVSKSEHINITLNSAGAINIYIHAEVDLTTGDTIDVRISGNGNTDSVTFSSVHPIID